MINNLPLRFKDDGTGMCEHLIPSQCRHGMNQDGLFMCSNGVVVKAHWCGTFNNEKGWCEKDLERHSQRLYGWTFSRVRSHWIARLGKVEDWWDRIKLYKV